MPKLLRIALMTCLASAIAQVVLLTLLAPDGGRVTLVDPALYLFMAGAPIFLAIVIWRRRTTIISPRSYLLFAILLAAVALVPMANEVIVRSMNRQPNQPQGPSLLPLIVPFLQWGPMLIFWMMLTMRERQERRATPIRARGRE